jgi:hypothetical protein
MSWIEGRARRGTKWSTTASLTTAWMTTLAVGLVALGACAAPVPGRAAAVDTAALPAPPGELAPGLVPPPEDLTARLLESLRLAPVTPVVQEVFPDHLSRECTTIGDLAAPDIIERSGGFPEGTITPILKRYGYVAGWRSCGAPAGAFVVTTALSLELADPAAARAAAADLAAASLVSGEEQTTVLNGARAQTSTDEDRQDVQIWVPVGRVLAVVSHQAPVTTALAEATRLAEAHVRLLSSFRPTPQAEVPALPVDPLGLGELTAPVPGDPAIGAGPYDLAATLHTAPDPVADRALFTANGYTGSYRHSTSEDGVDHEVVLDAFAGPAQAEAVRARFVADEAARSGRGPFTVPAVPDATCFVSDLTVPGASWFTQRCFLARGGYLARLEVRRVRAVDDITAMSGMVTAQVGLIDG